MFLGDTPRVGSLWFANRRLVLHSTVQALYGPFFLNGLILKPLLIPAAIRVAYPLKNCWED